jgi:predicted helicase
MSTNAVSKFKAINDFPALVEYLRDNLHWEIQTDDFEEMTFEYSAKELGLDAKTAPKFMEIRRLRPLHKDQPWGIFFIRFEESKLPVVALRRLLSKLALKKRSTSNTGDRVSWHENDLLLISQTGGQDEKSISFAHFASNPEKTDLPILKVLGWDNDDTGLKIDYVIETLREKLVWPDDPSDSAAWRAQWRDAFTLKNREVIQSSKEMAVRLGQLALAVRTRLREVLAIESDEGPIHKLMSVFKENLISDLDSDSFSDMYAQTIAYGLLSARIINPKANTADAAHTQIPITNPFLKELMETFLKVGGRSHTSGIGLDFDELGISEVVDLLDNNVNMGAILRDFGDRNRKEDPVMHFFEGFLQEYDSKIRKDRGVFYTPQPIVSFMVRSVDEQLRTEFDLEDGLADTTTWGVMAGRRTDLEIPKGTSSDQAFVQILDPATGTGTFPVEVIDLIYKTMTAKWRVQGNREAQIKELWNEYVPKFLLPRLHGYELMMAPYAIAHMKIGLKLYETGYNFASNERVRVYLTNALEPAQDNSGTFAFAIPALARESNSVNEIKRHQHFTVVIGNPPYSNFGSLNNSQYILSMLEDYKVGLNERKINLNDDYIKFIRYGQSILESSGYGVLAYISNSSYLDGVTHRRMREAMMHSFSSISLLNLHGNVRRKETSPNNMSNENVFDIQQGVAITVCVRNSFVNEKRNPQYIDLWGTRKEKHLALASSLAQKNLSALNGCCADLFLFVPSNREGLEHYATWPKLTEIFLQYGQGIQTKRDAFCIAYTTAGLQERLDDLISLGPDEVADKYRVKKLSASWSLEEAMDDVRSNAGEIIRLNVRPFDTRYTYFTGKTNGFLARPRRPSTKNMLSEGAMAIVAKRQTKEEKFSSLWVTSSPINEGFFSIDPRGRETIFPLKVEAEGDDKGSETLFTQATINIRTDFLGPAFAELPSNFVFSAIYALLSATEYQRRYIQYLKEDFPRVPLPKDKILCTTLSKLGEELILVQCSNENITNENYDTNEKLPAEYRNLIGQSVGRGFPKYSNDGFMVMVNDKTGISNVSLEVWSYYAGGYQILHKIMKDRVGHVLTEVEVKSYFNAVHSIMKSIELIRSIDTVIDDFGGFPGAFVSGEFSSEPN